ncbi:hypothetical protein CCACVL1_29288 [Corchorus capsularis]|uniref:Uncharacterized protein n=1 Tax=Corchorus capsularis TaxID=210143 RepID=A0A1R3G2G5_COCAP|nr:hypothetical protein CCACVL1_29288 [Corchorus capsularis]
MGFVVVECKAAAAAEVAMPIERVAIKM